MDNLTLYYKDLCEQLQYKLNLLEAGMKRAMQSGSPEQIRKEVLKKQVKKQDLRRRGEMAGEASFQALRAGNQPTAGSMGLWQMAAQEREVAQEQDIRNLMAKKALSGDIDETEKAELSGIARQARSRRDVASNLQRQEIKTSQARRQNLLGLPTMGSLYMNVGSAQY